jgi:hypothetical protein
MFVLPQDNEKCQELKIWSLNVFQNSKNLNWNKQNIIKRKSVGEHAIYYKHTYIHIKESYMRDEQIRNYITAILVILL